MNTNNIEWFKEASARGKAANDPDEPQTSDQDLALAAWTCRVTSAPWQRATTLVTIKGVGVAVGTLASTIGELPGVPPQAAVGTIQEFLVGRCPECRGTLPSVALIMMFSYSRSGNEWGSNCPKCGTDEIRLVWCGDATVRESSGLASSTTSSPPAFEPTPLLKLTDFEKKAGLFRKATGLSISTELPPNMSAANMKVLFFQIIEASARWRRKHGKKCSLLAIVFAADENQHSELANRTHALTIAEAELFRALTVELVLVNRAGQECVHRTFGGN